MTQNCSFYRTSSRQTHTTVRLFLIKRYDRYGLQQTQFTHLRIT